jgi:7,8-dihydropterin-6-yl-methyl-4-(beta-D-ribofuranosyl)aminobenzene 5'-phosphate synthase
VSSAEGVKLTILYDNREADGRLLAAHGFACLVEVGGRRILFDTGGDPARLFYNMGALGVDPRTIEAVVISHNHWDHTGALSALLSVKPDAVVHAPSEPKPEPVAPGARIVGPLQAAYKGYRLAEQALAVEAGEGFVLLVGCAHPGAPALVREAVRLLPGRRPLAVVGGLHLIEAGERQIEATADELARLGVEAVAPCHCTGVKAANALARKLKTLQCGAGAQLKF